MASALELSTKRDQFLAFVIRKVGDRTLAEDLVQDAFTRLDQLDHARDAEAWFYRVLRNVIIDRSRRDKGPSSRTDVVRNRAARGGALHCRL